jgi:hypothetical protein
MENILSDTSQGVEATEEDGLEIRVVDVADVFLVIAASFLPIPWQRGEDYLGGGVDGIEEGQADLQGLGVHVCRGSDQGAKDVVVTLPILGNGDDAVVGHRVERCSVEAEEHDRGDVRVL